MVGCMLVCEVPPVLFDVTLIELEPVALAEFVVMVVGSAVLPALVEILA